jgi:tetratricopeptide (TPR) repeat protein
LLFDIFCNIELWSCRMNNPFSMEYKYQNILFSDPIYKQNQTQLSKYLKNRFSTKFYDVSFKNGEFEWATGNFTDLNGTLSQMDKDKIPNGTIDYYISLEQKVDDISWIVDQLLYTTVGIKNSLLRQIPVNISDIGNFRCESSFEHGNNWIIIDRSFDQLVDLLVRAFYIEAFRNESTEFLNTPPSRQEILDLIRKAGRCYKNGEWNESIFGLNRLYFKQYININIVTAKLGLYFFLIAHEYGHIALDHFDHLNRFSRQFGFVNNSKGELFESHRQELEADSFAADLTLKTIKRLIPKTDDRIYYEFGIPLFLFITSLIERTIVLEMNNDYSLFQSTYGTKHVESIKRFHEIFTTHKNNFSSETISVINELLPLFNELISQLPSGNPDNSHSDRKRWHAISWGNGPPYNSGPSNPDMDWNRVTTLYHSRRFNDALELLDKLNKYDLPQGCHMKGLILSDLGNNDEALKWFNKALELDKEALDPLLQKAFCLKQLKKYSDSMSILKRLIRKCPDKELVWVLISDIFFELGAFRKSIKYAQKGLVYQHKSKSLWEIKAKALVRLNRPEEAVTNIKKAIEFAPRDEGLWFNSGVYLQAMAFSTNIIAEKITYYNQAINAFSKCYDINPDTWMSKREIGLTNVYLGNLDKAEKILIEIFEEHPEDELTAVNLGIILKNRHEYKQGLFYVQTALNIHTKSYLLQTLHSELLTKMEK